MKTINKYYRIRILKMILLATVIVSISFFDNYRIACIALLAYVFTLEKLL